MMYCKNISNMIFAPQFPFLLSILHSFPVSYLWQHIKPNDKRIIYIYIINSIPIMTARFNLSRKHML